MAHSPRKLPLAVGVFLVSAWLTLLAGSFHYAFGQSPERDELFQLVNQIQKLRDEKQISRAIPLAERALSMAQRTVPETDPRNVAVLITAGEVYWKAGDIQKAEPLLQRAAQIAEASLEPTHALYFTSLTNLALFYREQEMGAKSQPLFQKLVALMQKLRGPEDRQVAVYTKLLAESYFQQGDYAHARPLYERAAELFEKLGATNEQAYFATLNDLAVACEMTGDYVRAATLLSRVLDLKLKVYGSEHPLVANSLSNLASLARKTHNFEQAAMFYQKALAIYEKALGPESLEVADVANKLGLTYSDTGDDNRAIPYFRRSLAIREKKLGKDSGPTVEPLLNLAWIEYARGNYAQAEPAYLRTLLVMERTRGSNHPQLAEILAHVAMLYEAKGDIAKAVAAQKRSSDIAEHNLDLSLAQGTEEQKLLYMNTLRAETYGTISLHLRSGPANLDAAQLALTTVLRRKGRTLDVLSDSLGLLRRRLAPEDRALLDELTAARSKLAAVTLNDGEANESRQATLTQLEAEIARLETAIGARNAEFRVLSKPVTVEQVKAALPRGAALLEYVLYQPFKIKAGDNRAWDNPRYAVYLLQHDSSPVGIDLGEAAIIDNDLERLRAALRDPAAGDVKTIARAVDEKIMRPIRKLAFSARQFFVAPDGGLNLIPFAALVDERDKYLVENYSISYLTSGRDLLRFKSNSRTDNAPVIVANPSYDLEGNVGPQTSPAKINTSATPSSNRRSLDFTSLRYAPLPGTTEEATAIKMQLPEAKLLMRDQATEAAVKSVRSPRILHIATHGFFLPDQTREVSARDARQLDREKSASSRAAPLENPLLRSGLVLAGVKQRASGAAEDGVLTALEAAGLDLSETRLVVLSACETGLGDVANGEGVYGLRRALVLAGSETQVMSLWQVNDTATRDLMAAYYRRMKTGNGRAEAFRQVQLAMLLGGTFNHPYYWASFIQSGAWTNFDGR